MAQEQAKKLFFPVVADIKDHLTFLFSDMREYEDGRLEISILNQSETFTLDQIDAAVACAAKWNSEGHSVYTNGAVLDPNIAPFGRSCDVDFYATSVVWCDIDEPITKEALQKLYAHCRPNRAVITARHPHRRTQLWWKLDEAVTDTDTLREMLEGVQQALGGDPKVKNPTSLMRLGGTVNYPPENKRAKGRISEPTELHHIHDQKTSVDAMMRAYPAKEFFSTDHQTAAPGAGPTSSDPLGAFYDDGREQWMSNIVYAAIINLSEKHGRWATPLEVFEDAWPTYSMKARERDGKTLDQVDRGQKAMHQKIKAKLRLFAAGRIRNAPRLEDIVRKHRAKQGGQNEQNAHNAHNAHNNKENKHTTPPPIKATPIGSINLDDIPPREFLYHNICARKYATMIVAPPGAGKSIFTLHMAISAAAGKQWGAWGTAGMKPIRVWVYNNEEGIDELRRRIKGIMQEMGVTKEDLGDRLFVDSGENRAIEVARNGDGDVVVHTPDFHALKQEVIDRKIDMLIIDPFAETYSVKENDNDQIKQVARMYRDIAVEANCAVVLVHHTRKGMDGQAGNADMARGGSAQIGVVRRAFTLSSMGEDDAKALGVPMERKRWFVRFDDAKSNITAPQNSTDWFKLKSVHIGNGRGLFPEGDSVGVLIHTTIEDITAEFTGQLEEEYKAVFALVADYLDTCRIDSASITKIVNSLVSKPGCKYKKRKMQEMVKDAIYHLQKNYSVMCPDGQTFLSISEERDEKNSFQISRRVRSND